MKTAEKFRALRRRAAEFEAKRLSDDGRVVIVIDRRDPDAETPIETIPAIFDRADLDEHQHECARAASEGRRAEDVPPPVPLLDYSAWSYFAVCPRCSGRRLEVQGVGFVNGTEWDAVEKLLAAPAKARAKCLRPSIEGAARNCGWTGKAGELLYPCFGCGVAKAGAAGGQCAECAAAKRA